nr:restriction endonuclease subunit S [Pseudomonas sp. s4]
MSFTAYPAYRDSGVEWLGLIPEHWGIKQLKYLGRFRKGLTITKADLADTGIPCLNYGEVHSLYPFEVNQDIQPLKSVPPEYLETDPSACVKYGDFVFADTSEDLDGVGNFTHVSGMEPLFAGYHTIIYSLDSEVSSRFLAYCLDSFAFRTQLRLGVKGVKVFSVTQEILRGGFAWLPTKAEQTQVARFLDHETARIDALIEEQQRLIELLKEKRQAVISHAVTKGLGPTVPMKDSGVEWLGEVPAHWETTPLRYVATMIDGDRSSSYPSEDDLVDEGIPFVSSKNIVGYKFTDKNLSFITPEKFSSLGRGKLRDGDLVITVRGTIGHVAVFDSAVVGSNTGFINAQMMIIRPKAGLTEYLRLCSESSFWQKQLDVAAYGSTVKQLSNPIVGGLIIALPPRTEIPSLVSRVKALEAEFEELIFEAQMGTSLLQERRSALISAAVTGKIDVRGWQPPACTQAPKLEVAEAV